MVQVIASKSFWLTLAQIFFGSSALFKDLIIIRSCLVAAYTCLALNSLLGLPKNGTVYDKYGPIALDLVIWAILINALHVNALISMISDVMSSKRIKFTEEYNEIYNCFYRRSGMMKLEFDIIVKNSSIEEYKQDTQIGNFDRHKSNAFFLIEGIVKCQTYSIKNLSLPEHELHLYSGALFHLYLFNIFGIRLGYDKHQMQTYAHTNCKVMVIPLSALDKMARFSGPAIHIAWKNMLLYQMASSFVHRQVSQGRYYDAYGEREDKSFYDGSKSRDFSPLTKAEMDIIYGDTSYSSQFYGFINWIRFNFSPFPPKGVRHVFPIAPSSKTIGNNVRNNMLFPDESRHNGLDRAIGHYLPLTQSSSSGSNNNNHTISSEEKDIDCISATNLDVEVV